LKKNERRKEMRERGREGERERENDYLWSKYKRETLRTD
jgi:hypothetical protein